MSSVYDQLVQIARDKKDAGYLASYERDLTFHDKRDLQDSRYSRWVWALRSHGTELFPIGAGKDPVWLSYWLQTGNMRATPTLTYLIDYNQPQGRQVKPITYDHAVNLAKMPRH